MPLEKFEGMLLQHTIMNPNEKKSLYSLLLL
jgi:hypothetical protein